MLKSDLDAIKSKWEKVGFSLTPKKVPSLYPKHKNTNFYKKGSGNVGASYGMYVLTDYFGLALTDFNDVFLTYDSNIING